MGAKEHLNDAGELWFVISKDQGAKSTKKELEKWEKFSQIPIEIQDFIKYCRGLKFEEDPDYDYLRGLMIKCFNKNGKALDNLGNHLKNDFFDSSFGKYNIY